MRRKRRKAYKKWKILNTTECASQPSGQACQKITKDLENEVKGNSAKAVFHQTGALGNLKENVDEYMSVSMTGKQDSSFLPKDKKQSTPDSKICRKKENDRSPSAISHQLKQVLPVVMFNDCKESLSGKITLQNFPSTVKNFLPEKGKFITEVKCGAFIVQVEIKKSTFCKTGTQFPTKKLCPTCHQWFSGRHIRRGYIARSCYPKSNNISAGELKPKVAFTYEGEIARTESPSLKVSIGGIEIKVKYMSKKENILINIIPPKRRSKITKCRNISSSHTTKELSRSPSQCDIRHPEKWPLENKLQSSGGSHVSPPRVQKENSDTVVVSQTPAPKREKNKPDKLSSGPDDCEGESVISQQKVFKISQNASKKKHFSAVDTLSKKNFPTSCDTLKTTSLNNIELSKMPFKEPKDVTKESETISDILDNCTSDSQIQQSPERTKYLLDIFNNIIVPIRDGCDSDFCSLSSPSMQVLGVNAANIYCKGSQTSSAEGCGNANSVSFLSSQNALKSSTSFSPSHWASSHLELRDSPGNTFSFNHCATAVLEHEKEHGNMTDTDINRGMLHSDSYISTQQQSERKSIQSPTHTLASCSSSAAGSPVHSVSHSTVGWDQTEAQANHLETTALSRTKVPVMTFLTEELEPRLTTQNHKAGTVDCNCPIEMRNPTESPSDVGNVKKEKCQIISVVKSACHRDFEELCSEHHDEICLQVDFPPRTAEPNCTVCATDKLFLMEKTLNSDAHQYGNQDEKSLGPTSFQQEPAECQRITSRPISEGDENKNDPKENYYQQIYVLLSPQKQNALKDQNLEISSLRKLSQELALRGERASDGSQEEAIDQWARRRQQFKDGKRCSSAGGSSFTSNITEGSITSEDGRSIDFVFRVDIEEKGFYTENFHSAAWVFRGDDGSPEDSPRCLSQKPRPVAVRERTVRLFKGTGDYPWGFRIQFSKPIMVTEVDTNSAAEEAGLQIGDVVLSVNGTEVTSAEHAEAVHLARKGPDILTLVVGSDISRCPNTPWPTCRGYLHKRTHSGFLKGWRKRWFVLKHDGYLHYYKHKKDEGKWPPLEVIKLEGAEVGVDNSLGKPFVFNCIPQSGNRTFCLCATSNQEMKRWLEAMDKAAHPIRQNHVWEDVTLHNSSLPPLAIKNPECLGLLHQLDRSMDTWVQHYCILKDGCLYFYASIRSTQASGGLYLQGYRVSEQTHSFKQSVIELKPPSEEFKTFYFCAENKTENQRWITALRTSIKKWLPLHQAIQEFMNRPLEETKM